VPVDWSFQYYPIKHSEIFSGQSTDTSSDVPVEWLGKISECLIGSQIPFNEIMSDRSRRREAKGFLNAVQCFEYIFFSIQHNFIKSRIQMTKRQVNHQIEVK
jgi:hypothetical protein